MNKANQALSRATEAMRDDRHGEANALLIECLESASSIRDDECLSNALVLVADNLFHCCPEGENLFERRKMVAQEALRLSRECGNRRGESHALLILASVDADLDLGNESLGVAREIGDKPLMAMAMEWISNALWLSGKKQEGVRVASEAVQLARECNAPELLVQTLFTLGLLSGDDVPAQVAAFEEMARVPARDNALGRRLVSAATYLVDEGKFDRAESFLQKSLAIARKRGDVGLEGSVLRIQARLLRERGGEEAKAEELEAMANVLGGPVLDLSEAEKVTESGDMQGLLATLKALLG